MSSLAIGLRLREGAHRMAKEEVARTAGDEVHFHVSLYRSLEFTGGGIMDNAESQPSAPST